ncbi:MAG: hypothetical protein Q7T41_03910, partial [Candidatus Saccharibacteria bacterium]|nr:hypothetical protein [Candidatus Saccharibacteria bacterium]
MNNTIPDIGWLEVTPEAFDLHAIKGINDLSYRKESTFQFAGEAPLQPEQVVAIKLGVFATNDLPFWTSEEIENTGSRVVYVPGINGNLSIGPDGVGIARAYHYEPTLGGIVRSRLTGVKAPVDSVQSEDVTRKLAGLGIVTLFQPDHLVRTTKDKTKEIATSAGVNSPFSRCCANVVFPNSLFRELSETGYREFVIKPNNGVQGDEVEFLDLDLGHDDFDSKVEGKSDVIIEQRIIPKLLNIDGVEHDWNIRSVVLEGGQVGWYVRACAMGGPVNISKGAFLLTQDELSNYLPEMINLDSKVKEFSEKVGSVFPEGLIAVDIIVNKDDGELYLIEVNTGNIVCTSYPDYPDPKAISVEERQSVADNLVKGYKKAALRQSLTSSEEVSVDFDNGESRVEVALDYISKILSDGDTNYGVYLLLDVLDYIKKISSTINENARQYLIGRTLHTAHVVDYYSDKKNDEMHRFVFVELASAG